jgi:hypothetical protein
MRWKYAHGYEYLKIFKEVLVAYLELLSWAPPGENA